MKTYWILTALALSALVTLAACSGGDDARPADPGVPSGDGVFFANVSFNDFGADARRVLPPVYNQVKAAAVDIWHDGDYPVLGKVFGADEPMSIHRNIDDHERTMEEIEQFVATIADYEAENGELPTEPIDFTDPEHGSGTMTIRYAEPAAPIAVPAVCQTVFGRTEVAVDHVLQVSVTMDAGDGYESPYFGFTTEGTTEVVYYWAVGLDEQSQPVGSQLFYAAKDSTTGVVEIAGAYFKADGPGEEERCNWVYHLTGDPEMQFTYNMGWYSENPQFELFACVEGSGDKDQEFGLRYHQYTDQTGWDQYDPEWVSEEVFGPVGDDDFAFIAEPERSGSIADYVDESVMYQRDDSPLAEIPNPFAGVFE